MRDSTRTLKLKMQFAVKLLTLLASTSLIRSCACSEFEFSSIFPQTGRKFSRDATLSDLQNHPVLTKLELITSALDQKLDLIGKFDEAIANILLSFDAKIEKIHEKLDADERNINELTSAINARLVQLDSKLDDIDDKIKSVLIECDKQGPLHVVLSEHKAASDIDEVAQQIRESLDGFGEKIQSNILGDGEKLEYLKRYLQVVFEQDKNLNISRSPVKKMQTSQRIERKTAGNTDDLINEILGMVKNRLRSRIDGDDAKKVVDAAPGSMTDIVDSFENRRSQIDTQKNKTAASRKDMLIFPNIRNKPAKLNNTFISDNANAYKEARGFSCVELMNAGMRQSGVYYLQIRGTTYWFLKVYCEQEIADGGWTVIQRRGDFGKSQENFNRDWSDYKNGFGDPAKEFWMGNENIFMLTNNEDYALRIELEDFEGNKRYAQYSKFKLHSEADYYKLEIDGYEGTAGDSLNDLTYGANNSPFSTYNRDNDRSSLNCASMLKGGWWWRSCGRGLNGLYLRDPYDVAAKQGIIWFTWKGWEYTLKTATMMVKPLTKSMTSPPTSPT